MRCGRLGDGCCSAGLGLEAAVLAAKLLRGQAASVKQPCTRQLAEHSREAHRSHHQPTAPDVDDGIPLRQLDEPLHRQQSSEHLYWYLQAGHRLQDAP